MPNGAFISVDLILLFWPRSGSASGLDMASANGGRVSAAAVTAVIERTDSGRENAEANLRRRCIQLVVPGDPDFCSAIVRKLVRKPVRAPGPQSERVHGQMCPCLSTEARTGPAR
jgi:hypothetical protein